MMTLKALFLCACLAATAFGMAFSQSVPFVFGENDTASFDNLSPFRNAVAGNVAPLSVTEYQGASFDALVRAKSVSYREGKPVAEIVYAADGSVLNAVSYTYTAAGLLTEISGADSLGAPKWAYRYEYGDGGKLLREVTVGFADGKEVKEGEVVFSYDANGLLSKRETLSAKGTVTLSEAFAYDESGRLTEKNSYYGNGTLLKRETCEYAGTGSKGVPEGAATRVRQYDSNGLYQTTLFEYEGGRISAVLRYGSDSVLKDRESFYYMEGKPVRRIRLNAGGTKINDDTRLYDWAGNMVLERDDSRITVWEFVYPEA